jgi:trk system potassium uptake protein TrkH
VAERAEYLRYAVRPWVLLKYFGQACIILALLTAAPMLISFVSGEITAALRYAAVMAALAVTWAGLRHLPEPSRVQANEGLVLAAGLFLFFPLLMVFPMMGAGLSFLDAFFEAVSGATTTGLSTLAAVETEPPAFLFARAWMQWYGGLGIMILSVALVVQPGLAAKGLALGDIQKDNLWGGTRPYARRILLVYCSLTGIGILALIIARVAPFDALLYILASVSTGGFSPRDGSLAALEAWPAQAIVLLICFTCAVSLVLYHDLFQKGRWRTANFLQLKALATIGVVGTVLFAFSLYAELGLPWAEIVRHSPFMVFSAQTTAGFSTMDTAALPQFSKLLLMGAMVIGGGVGSTAGGFKVLRLLIVLRFVQVLVARTSLARHAFMEPRLAGQRLQSREVQEALAIILLFMAVIAISWIFFVAEGFNPLDSLFEVISATATVGLSAGVTGPELPGLLKLVLCMDMLLGRVEILSWFVVLNPHTWAGRRSTEK